MVQQSVSDTASSNRENSPLSENDIILSHNPATGEIIGQVSITRPEDAASIVSQLAQGQVTWSSVELQERITILQRLYELMVDRHPALVQLLGQELCKIEHEARFEILQAILNLRYMLWKAPRALKPKRVFVWQLPYRMHKVLRQPHGVVLVISPWNFPVALAFDAIIPALLAGNSVIFKPSEHAPLVGQFMADLIAEAGVPEDVFKIVQGDGKLGAALIDARPDKISFTGSVPVGRKIAQKAGDLLIPVTLELGGKDAALVLADADLKRSARGVLWGSMVNSGQMCLGVERVYVMESVTDRFVQELRQAVRKSLRVGQFNDPQATLGLLTLSNQADIVRAQVSQAEEFGATLYRDYQALGKLKQHPHLIEPLILTDVPPEAEIVRAESFGPVMVVIPVANEAEAIQKINDSEFGLTTSIWTQNSHNVQRIAPRLKVGLVHMNEHILSSAAPQIPWGGRKQSGYGRHRGADGFLAMTVPQAISTEWFKLPFHPFAYPYNRFKRGLVRRLMYIWAGSTFKQKLKGLRRRVP